MMIYAILIGAHALRIVLFTPPLAAASSTSPSTCPASREPRDGVTIEDLNGDVLVFGGDVDVPESRRSGED